MSRADGAVDRANETPAFATTRWSLIVSARSRSSDEIRAAEALAELCRIYWKPVFFFILRRGYSREDAQDLTQDFFLMVVERDWLRQADAERGRFRSFLLKSVQNFLGHDADKRRAEKRGGKVVFISWDDPNRDAALHFSLQQQTLETMAAEQIFDVRWAATVVEQALSRLKRECEANGRRRLFDVLSAHLAIDRSDVSYAELACGLRVAESAVKRQLHLLRQRYRSLLREEIAETLADPADLDEEIRYLCAILALHAR